MSKNIAGINVSGSGSPGAAGADGADGNTILYGTAAPTTEGVDGDFYIRTTTNMLYGPKASGVWPSGTSLVGPAGSTGPAGADADVSALLVKANNLSDVASAETARDNLGLGDAATRDVGSTAGTVAAGDDSRITGALQASGNLSGIADAAVARANLDVGELFTPAVGTSFNIIPPLGWSHTQALDGVDSIRLWPVEVPEAMTISAMSIYIRSAASAGVWRMGWYLLDGANGLPRTLIAEAGTIIPTSTGEKAITGLSINLPRGWIAFGMAQQSSPSGGAWLVGLPQQNGLLASTGAHCNCYNATAAGAFPSTITAAPTSGEAPPSVKVTRSA